jgi:hypothetical protein
MNEPARTLSKPEEFAKDFGWKACQEAMTEYKHGHNRPEFPEDTVTAMCYVSGFTVARVAKAFIDNWITPLQSRTRVAIAVASASFVFFGITLFYCWSVMSQGSFRTFLTLFVPGAAALLFSISNSYKTWSEGKKNLAEARKIEAESKRMTQER